MTAECLTYFNGVDRTAEGWEGLMTAQECLSSNEIKDAFGADYIPIAVPLLRYGSMARCRSISQARQRACDRDARGTNRLTG